MTTRKSKMGLVTALLGSLAAVVLAPAANAAPGQIAYDGCVANDASQSCADLPFDPLSQAMGVTVSPDGKSVYVASPDSNSIAHFFRGAPDGQVSYDGCLASNASQGCFDVPDAPLGGASSVAVTLDGKSVYAASFSSDTVSHLLRNGPDGQLAWGGCLKEAGHDGCTAVPGDGARLDEPRAVAVSPDGTSVYVASSDRDEIAHLRRNTVTGQLSLDGCLNNDGSSGCVDLPGDAPIDGANAVAVSPDGKSVYVTAADGDSVAHLFRATEGGHISWDGCLNNDGSDNCADLPGDAPITTPSGVAVSPDGRSVYVTGAEGDSVAHLFRSSEGGQISWDGCLNNDGSHNCDTLPGAPLDGAAGVAVSPDGRSVYVASSGSNSITHLFRHGPDGQLSYDRCLANSGSSGCVNLPLAPLSGAQGVAVSPDDKSVYVASTASNSIAHFFREPTADPQSPAPQSPAPEAPSGEPGPGSTPADTLAPRISGLALTNRRFRVGRRPTALAARSAPAGTTLRYTLSEPATVTVAIERPAAGRRAGGRCHRPSPGLRRRPVCTRYVPAGPSLSRQADAGPNSLRFSGRIGARALRPGAYRALLTATDPAGNRSSTARVRFRLVRK